MATAKATINGINIKDYNAEFFGITLDERDISNSSEAMDGTFSPFLIRPTMGLNEYSLIFHVYGNSRYSVWDNESKLLKAFQDVCTVYIDQLGNASARKKEFILSLKSVSRTEYGQGHRWSRVVLKCVGYCKGKEISSFSLSGITEDSDDFSVTFSADDIASKFVGSVPVIANISLSQYRLPTITSTDTGANEAEIGNPYPIAATVTISGVCLNSYGKDMGDFVLTAYPLSPTGEKFAGMKEITVNGLSGKYTFTNNVQAEYGCGYVSVSMPSPIVLGQKGQEISMKIKGINQATFKNNFTVALQYYPIYL